MFRSEKAKFQLWKNPTKLSIDAIMQASARLRRWAGQFVGRLNMRWRAGALLDGLFIMTYH